MVKNMDEIELRHLEYLWVILASKKEKELRLEGELKSIKDDIYELNREIENILRSKRKRENREESKNDKKQG